MEIVVDGFTSPLCDEIVQAAKFYGNILFHAAILSQIAVYIEYAPSSAIHAETFAEDLDNRIFCIEIRNHPDDDDIFQTLAHELVHVKQWATRQYIVKVDPASPGGVIELWNGKIWRPTKTEHPYYDCPWEIDAMGREIGLYHRWRAFKEGRLV